ncbi:MAG: large subunit ribosomal protein L4 [Sphingobacteriales bacterium]|jgi:large subunit ribosomal protein L4
MEVSVYNTAGKETGKQKLSKAVFGIEPNDHAIYLDVKQFLANQRQGTHKSKERGEISGSTRKLRKQKGSGAARVGSIKSPIFRGGGRVFGPRPRNYSFKLNKKLKDVARISALSYKAKEECIMLLEDFKMEAVKTKEFVAILNNLNINNEKSLLVLSEADKNIYLSSRNVPKTKVMTTADLNTYELVNTKKLVITTGAFKALEEQFKG